MSSKNKIMKATLAVAVLAIAAFVGVFVVGEESDAEESWSNDGKGEFSVTYSFDGSSIVKKMATDNKFQFEKISSVVAPSGYELSAWKDAKSGAIYDFNQTYTFSGDVTVEPVFKANKAIVKLVFGDISKEFVGDSTKVISESELKEFGELIDAKFDLTSNKSASSETGEITKNVISSEKTGYEFKGFFATPEVKDNALTLNDLKQDGAGVATYYAIFEKVYQITFMDDKTQVDKIYSNEITFNEEKKCLEGIHKAIVRDNYIFMGWYNAAGEKVIGYSVDKNEYTFAKEGFAFTEDTVLYAKFVPLTYTVTFVYGEAQTIFETETVKYGEKAIEPKGLPEGYKGWDFDFSAPITEDTVIVAVEADPVTIYNVTFKIEGKSDVMQKSDSIVVPDTAIEGKVFKGWLVEGQTQYVDPMKYEITEDVVFVAVYDKAPAPAGPGFFETTEGQCVAVIIAVALIAFVYAVYSNMFGMKDFITSFKLQRVKK